MFAVSKTGNANRVVYAVRLDAQCRPVGESPVTPYWEMLEQGEGRTEPLSALERRVYGVARQRVIRKDQGSGTVEMAIRALPHRTLQVETSSTLTGCQVSAIAPVSGEPARLSGVHALIRWGFRVESLLLSGVSLADGRLLHESIRP